jgi:hypothetical protein
MQCKIRKAELEDFNHAEDLVNEFMKESLFAFGTKQISKEYLYKIMGHLVSTSWVATKDYETEYDEIVFNNGEEKTVKKKRTKERIIGIITGMIVKDFLSGDYIFQEVMWYVLKENRSAGVFLFKRMEEELKQNSVKRIIMAHLANETGEKLAEFYKKSGYKPLEVQYIKEL